MVNQHRGVKMPRAAGAHFCFSRKRRCASRFLDRRSSFLLALRREVSPPEPTPRPLRRRLLTCGCALLGSADGSCEPWLVPAAAAGTPT